MAWRVTFIDDPVYNATLTYDANGNILNQVRSIGNQATSYGALDQLTSRARPGASFKTYWMRRRSSLADNGQPVASLARGPVRTGCNRL